jgi:hypothetical protein
MNIDFEIKPYIGVGDLQFGMKQDEVARVLGLPDQVSRNHLNQRVEFRSFMNVAFSSEKE